MWSFIGGLFTGAILGMVVIALMAAKNLKDDIFETVNRIRKAAKDAEEKAKATDDPLKQAEAEGMWNAVLMFYEEA